MLPFDSWPLGMVSLRCARHSIFSGGMPPVGGPRERILATESEDLLWRGSLEVTSLLTTSTSPKTSLMNIHLIYYWSLPRIENFLPPGAGHSSVGWLWLFLPTWNILHWSFYFQPLAPHRVNIIFLTTEASSRVFHEPTFCPLPCSSGHSASYMVFRLLPWADSSVTSVSFKRYVTCHWTATSWAAQIVNKCQFISLLIWILHYFY